MDGDPQGSTLAWSSARDKDHLFPVVGMTKPTLHREWVWLSLIEAASDAAREITILTRSSRTKRRKSHEP